jgi:hypothetical protein
MPYSHEHAAEQTPVAKCDKFRRENDKFGPGVDVIWCVKGGKADVQSIRFDAEKFTPEEARAWLKKHDYSADKFEPASGKGKAKAAAAADDLEIKAAYDRGLITTASEALELLAAREGEGGKRLRPFAMTAYTGAAMRLPNFFRPVVIDLVGMKIPTQAVPILRGHDPERIVAHSEKIELSAQRMRVGGVMSGIGPAAQEVLQLAENGFPWQASVGADVQPGGMESVEAGASAKANGRNFDGPLLVARKTVLHEISFVPAGADPNTSATVAQ